MVDARNFRVSPAFFELLAEVPAKYPGLRAMVMVVQISSDPETECQDRRMRVARGWA